MMTYNSQTYTISSLNEEIKHNTDNKFFIIHQNIRSFSRNYDEFSATLSALNKSADVIVLSETFFNVNYCANIDGYDAYHVFRPIKKGGGISVYAKNNFQSSAIVNMSICHDDYETNVVNVTISKSISLVIIGIYRPPPKDKIVNFVRMLTELLESCPKNSQLFMIGDLNIDLLEPIEAKEDFIALCYSKKLLPLINCPTRVFGNSSTLIDHAWTDQLYDDVLSGVIEIDITDHYPIFAFLPILFDKNSLTLKKFRDHSEANIQNFIKAVEDNITIESLTNCPDIDIRMEVFSDQLTSLYNIHCPIRTKQISENRILKPWITNEIKNDIIEKKHDLYRQYLRNEVSFNDYKKRKNRYTTMLRKVKTDYYHNKFRNCVGNASSSWKLINSLIKHKTPPKKIKLSLSNHESDDPSEVANAFNDYFSNIGAKLNDEIPTSNVSPLHYMSNFVTDSFFASPTDSDEVATLIRAQVNKSSNLSTIPIFIYKLLSNTIAPILSELFNQSITQGIFPNCLKVARVIPIFKAGKKNLTKNYRPISMLPFISKIFEKLMCSRVNEYLKSNNILSKHQFGFRKNSSTDDAILEFIDNIHSSLNNQESVVTVFLDFSKAFDTVNHRILLQKMYKLGFRGIMLNWFESYLSNRKQFVNINNCNSHMTDVSIGVPQGSVLGPLLFLLYINDMSESTRELNFIHFADDTTVFTSGKDQDAVMRVVNQELTHIDEWLKANRLSLNVEKTSFMVITNKKSPVTSTLQIRGKTIKKVDNTKFLGIILDDHLNFKLNTTAVVNKMSRSIGVIRRVCHLLPDDVILKLYYSMIYTHMIYGILAWGKSGEGNLNRIRVSQRRALKLFHPGSEAKNKLTKFDLVYVYFAGVKMYNIMVLDNHPYFRNKFLELLPKHSYETRHAESNKLYYPKKIKLEKMKTGFLCQAIPVWNNIPDEIMLCKSKYSFKHNLKMLTRYKSQQLDNS